jgi:hypothetical protein
MLVSPERELPLTQFGWWPGDRPADAHFLAKLNAILKCSFSLFAAFA